MPAIVRKIIICTPVLLTPHNQSHNGPLSVPSRLVLINLVDPSVARADASDGQLITCQTGDGAPAIFTPLQLYGGAGGVGAG